jgi:hypothetical protein
MGVGGDGVWGWVLVVRGWKLSLGFGWKGWGVEEHLMDLCVRRNRGRLRQQVCVGLSEIGSGVGV